MRIGALNCAHMAIRRPVQSKLLDALLALDCDVLILNEFVETPEWVLALQARWPSVLLSPQRPFNTRGRWCNQIAALSGHSLKPLGSLAPHPSVGAMTNSLRFRCEGWEITGLRAPAYPKAADWYAYWAGAALRGDVVIGDLNVDPRRGRKRDRVLPPGWQVATGDGFSFACQRGSDRRSAIDHALLRPGLGYESAGYAEGFLGRWGLDHKPLVLTLGEAG